MTYYVDGPNAEKNGKDYQMKVKEVSKNDVLPISFASNGGFVAVFEKL